MYTAHGWGATFQNRALHLNEKKTHTTIQCLFCLGLIAYKLKFHGSTCGYKASFEFLPQSKRVQEKRGEKKKKRLAKRYEKTTSM